MTGRTTDRRPRGRPRRNRRSEAAKAAWARRKAIQTDSEPPAEKLATVARQDRLTSPMTARHRPQAAEPSNAPVRGFSRSFHSGPNPQRASESVAPETTSTECPCACHRPAGTEYVQPANRWGACDNRACAWWSEAGRHESGRAA